MWRACVCGSGDCVGVVRGGHGVAWGLCLHCVAADGGGSCVGGTGGTIYIPPSLPCTCCNSVGAPVSGFPLSLLPGCRRRGADCSHSAIRWCCGCSGRAMRSHAQAPLHPCVKSFQHGSSRRRINETHALHTQTELQGSRWGERLVASALRQGASTAPLESSPSTPAILVYYFATPAATHTHTHSHTYRTSLARPRNDDSFHPIRRWAASAAATAGCLCGAINNTPPTSAPSAPLTPIDNPQHPPHMRHIPQSPPLEQEGGTQRTAAEAAGTVTPLPHGSYTYTNRTDPFRTTSTCGG